MILALLFATFAHAQVSPFPACRDFIVSQCPAAHEAGEVIQCLRAHAGELSAPCKEDLERYVQTARQAAARGGGALSSFGGLTSLTPPVSLLGYEGRWSRDLSVNRLSLSSPVAGSASGVTSVSVSTGLLHAKDPVVMTTGQTLPQDLYRAEIAAQYSGRLADKKSFSVRVSAGSTGDQVFQSMRDANFSVIGTYGFPGSAANDYWVALLSFANNSTLGDYIPIPGIVWVHRAPHLTAVVGFPVLSLQYTPDPLWSYSFSVFGTTLVTEAAYGAVDEGQAFLQASFNQERYILHDRLQDRDRLTFEERKVLVGYRRPLFAGAFGELQVGRAFGRSFYIGQHIFRDEGGDVDLDKAGFADLQLKYVF